MPAQPTDGKTGRRQSAQSAALDRRIRALIAAKWTSGRIAAELGLTRNQVCGRAARMGATIGRGHSGGWKTARPNATNRSFAKYPQLGLRDPYKSGCRWIEGHPNEIDSHWCGAPVDGTGASWCADHGALICRKVPPPGDPAAPDHPTQGD